MCGYISQVSSIAALSRLCVKELRSIVAKRSDAFYSSYRFRDEKYIDAEQCAFADAERDEWTAYAGDGGGLAPN